MRTINVGSPCLDNQVVPVREKVSSRRPLATYLASVFLFVALCCQLCVRVSITQKGYELERLRSSVERNRAQLARLELEHAQILRPQELMRRAQLELGMVELSPVNVRRIAGHTETSLEGLRR